MTVAIVSGGVLIALTALYLFLTMPSLSGKRLDFLQGTLIAHRGVHDSPDVAENSLGAFRLAIEDGRPIEIDVHLSADGVPVVIHDGSLSRVCGVDLQVKELTVAEIKKHPLIKGGEEIPTLAEVLEAVDGRVPLLIEIKGNGRGMVSDVTWQTLKSYKGDFAVQSFNPYYVYRFRRLAPHVPVGILAERRNHKGKVFSLRGFLREQLMYNHLYRPDFISYKCTDKLPPAARLCRVKVYAWTVRDEATYKRCKGRYDALICERIDTYEDK